MFDFAWSELGVIAVVALIFIGPKDMPVAVKGVTGMIKKARRMASEFQGHVDDLMRDSELHEVRDQISALRGYSIKGALDKFVDEDGTIRRSFENPLVTPAPAAPVTEILGDVAVAERTNFPAPMPESEPEEVHSPEPHPDAPAFIPPGAAPRSSGSVAASAAPAFIPPGYIAPELRA